jgi:branched-subunit amino acid aminotransferase/4-amino-4-deoxychorismate lyase
VIAYVDGKWTPADEARISVLDHGLLYGDGVFEGIRVYGGAPFLLDEHLKRLAASARAIVLELPAERAEIAALCREAAARAGLDDGYLRLVVTRGAGALGVSPHLPARQPDRDRRPLTPLSAGALPGRRAPRHLEPSPQRQRRAATAGQEPSTT